MLRRRAVVVVAVLAACGLIVNLAARGHSRPHRATADLGCACAGYRWFGPVTAVSATWTVPRLGSTTLGSASGWIGAQSGGVKGPFIQIGITEDRCIPQGLSNMHLPPSDYQVLYSAFWSDAAHGYHPADIGLVRPGDAVHASLKLIGGRWRMHLVDRPARLDIRLSTRQEAAGPMDEAEWAQEDVEYGGNRLFPYPRLSPFTFGELKVNGHDPGPKRLFRDSMPARSRIVLTPTPVGADQFTIDPARPRHPDGPK